MQHWTDQYDTELLNRIAHYRAYPQMLPFVGREYGRTRMLIIAESNYLPRDSKIHIEEDRWYDGNENLLNKQKEQPWISIRGTVDGEEPRWKHKGHAIFRNLASALRAAGLEPSPSGNNIFDQVAYMNCFLRPAFEKLSLNVGERDRVVSRAALSTLVDVIRPRAVCFVSMKAWNEVGRHIMLDTNVKVEAIAHPACAWWNRVKKSSGVCARDQFISFVKSFGN